MTSITHRSGQSPGVNVGAWANGVAAAGPAIVGSAILRRGPPMPPTVRCMATSFDYVCQAKTYDTTRAASPSVLAPIREAFDGLAAGSVLDVGGGTGNYAQAMATGGWQPVVIDRSPDMLARAAAKGLATCRADAADLPMDDGSVDAVMLVSMLHHVPDWSSALDEARRVVRPGGVVALMAFTREQLAAHGVEAYFPETMAHFADQHQARAELLAALPGAREHLVFYEDVVDGSLAALARRPRLLLDPEVRRQTSFVEWAAQHRPAELSEGTDRLAADLLVDGTLHGDHLTLRADLGDASVLSWQRPFD